MSFLAPSWAAIKNQGGPAICSSFVGERHLWDHRESLLQLAGRGVMERAGLEDQRRGILSRFGPQAMRNTLVLLWCIFGVLEILN